MPLDLGDLILADIEEKIKELSIKYGLDYEKNVRVPMLDMNSFSFAFLSYAFIFFTSQSD